MVWPWVNRRELEAAVQGRTRLAEELRRTELALLRAQMEATQMHVLAGDREAKLTEAHRDNKILIDRIAQMSGQPPIFHPLPVQPGPAIVPEPAAAESSNIPAPTTRLSFDDIHRKAREAIKNKSQDPPERARV